MKEVKNVVLNSYLKKLRKKLGLMSSSKKKAILKEIESHLRDIADEMGGPSDANFKKAIERFGSEKDVARQLKKDFGKGSLFIFVAVAITIILSLFTIPIGTNIFKLLKIEEVGTIIGLVSVFITILTFGWIILVGVIGGKWKGLIAGTSAFIVRSLVLFFVFLTASIISSNTSWDIQVGGGVCCGITFISILMILTGFFSGRTLKKFKKDGENWDFE